MTFTQMYVERHFTPTKDNPFFHLDHPEEEPFGNSPILGALPTALVLYNGDFNYRPGWWDAKRRRVITDPALKAKLVWEDANRCIPTDDDGHRAFAELLNYPPKPQGYGRSFTPPAPAPALLDIEGNEQLPVNGQNLYDTVLGLRTYLGKTYPLYSMGYPEMGAYHTHLDPLNQLLTGPCSVVYNMAGQLREPESWFKVYDMAEDSVRELWPKKVNEWFVVISPRGWGDGEADIAFQSGKPISLDRWDAQLRRVFHPPPKRLKPKRVLVWGMDLRDEVKPHLALALKYGLLLGNQ